MKLKWALIFPEIFLSVLLHVLVFGQRPTSFYRYNKFLDPDRKYQLFWNINETAIQFEVRVQTLGYIGFGISKSGKMNPADMIIGWVQGIDVYFGDYHTLGDSRTPYYDTSQDWFLTSRPGLIYADESNGYTTIAFERKLDTCDKDDEVISGDTMRIIYSYHDSDPNITSGLFPHHGYERRGSMYMLFTEHNQEPTPFPQEGTWALPFKILNYTIPKQLLTRQCLVFDAKDSRIPVNSNLIMFAPNIDPPGNEMYVYRMMLYRCNIDAPGLINNRFDCTDGGPSAIRECTNILATWSRGGEPFYFPPDTDISLSGPDDPTIYVLHIHYTNTRGITGAVDSSGLTLYYSTYNRANEAAFLTLGAVISSNHKQRIPPQEERFTTSTFCSRRCVEWGFRNVTSQINAIGVIFHGNDIAKGMKLRHFRDNVELPWISADKQYDSFYQSARVFAQPVRIEPTDMLSLECTYNSSDRQAVTKGGWSQIEELCQATLIYYPPLPVDQCLSWSTMDQLFSVTGHQIPKNMTKEYLDNIDPWDADAKKRFISALEMSTQKALCSSQEQYPNYAIDTFPRPTSQNLLEYTEPGSQCLTTTAVP